MSRSSLTRAYPDPNHPQDQIFRVPKQGRQTLRAISRQAAGHHIYPGLVPCGPCPDGPNRCRPSFSGVGGPISAIGLPCLVTVTRSPRSTAARACANWARASRTDISMTGLQLCTHVYTIDGLGKQPQSDQLRPQRCRIVEQVPAHARCFGAGDILCAVVDEDRVRPASARIAGAPARRSRDRASSASRRQRRPHRGNGRTSPPPARGKASRIRPRNW